MRWDQRKQPRLGDVRPVTVWPFFHQVMQINLCQSNVRPERQLQLPNRRVKEEEEGEKNLQLSIVAVST